jgi:hypothetical protein
MEYYLQLLEALDEYEFVLDGEPPTGKELIRDWCTRCAVLERRIGLLTEKLKDLEVSS